MSDEMEYEMMCLKHEQESMESIVANAVSVMKTETMKPSTINVYTRQIKKLYTELSATSDVEKWGSFHKYIPNFFVYNPKGTIEWLENKPWGVKLSDRTLKNYLSVIQVLLRNYKNDNANTLDAYETYFTHFNTLKNSLNAEQEKQLPKEDELILKDLTMEKLSKYMVYWEKKCKGIDNTDVYSGFMYAMGHIHLDQVLRNELKDIIISDEYLVAVDYPKTNFIWNKGRNAKLLVIRQNKVRHVDRGDPPKEVWIKGKVNTAINKYIQILHRNDIFLDSPKPFCWSVADKTNKEMSSSLYSQTFRKLFAHEKLPISTTDLRKVYAIEIRKKHGGNLLKEKEACNKLDHNKDTHDKHYILEF